MPSTTHVVNRFCVTLLVYHCFLTKCSLEIPSAIFLQWSLPFNCQVLSKFRTWRPVLSSSHLLNVLKRKFSESETAFFFFGPFYSLTSSRGKSHNIPFLIYSTYLTYFVIVFRRIHSWKLGIQQLGKQLTGYLVLCLQWEACLNCMAIEVSGN